MRLVSAGVYEDALLVDGEIEGLRPRTGPITSAQVPLPADVAILIVLAVEPSEYRGAIQTALRIIPPDGSGGVVIQTEDETIPERPRWMKGYRLPDLGFPMFGPYEFRFEIDGALIATIPLSVERIA